MASYLEFLEAELSPPRPRAGAPLVLDLFAGCGGLALGFEAAGFRTLGYEMDEAAATTYNANLRGLCEPVVLDPTTEFPQGAAVIIGGPPCQPFSVGGYQLGLKDARDGFPTFISAVARYHPEIAIFENVRGMLYRNRSYLDEIIRALESLGYLVVPKLLNAVHYGVPQNRERMFVVAHKGHWEFPKASPLPRHFTAGDALGELAQQVPEGARFLTPSMDAYVARYEAASKCIRPRDLHLDRPSRTVTCRNLSGATGDMLRVRLPDGRRRRLTVREGARLQSFPDWFAFAGSEQSQFDQIGNAVPPLLAKAIAVSVRSYLSQPRLSSEEIAMQIGRDRQLHLSLG